ncbi:unnamed protein product [Gongylonema pulchrum]|uniref:Serine incorporator 5 n=1 Tax=Gongylonema pulchrum TaxID=637853 RepID=A0A183D3J6_9BILA|nr:unnamed protein product [Gongylonema pulchrum]
MLTSSYMNSKYLHKNAAAHCGHLFHENISYLSDQAIENLKRPPQSAYLSVCGVYFCCTIVALMIVLLFLNSLRKDEIASGLGSGANKVATGKEKYTDFLRILFDCVYVC